MKSTVTSKKPNGHGSLYKEVRFSPSATPVPIRRTQSVATSNPLLDPVYAASIGGRATDVDLYNQVQTYVEQARALLDSQRASFDREREIFQEERKLWGRERKLLRARIAELESAVKGQADGPKVSTIGSFTSSFKWKQVSFAPQSFRGELANSCPVWEGSSPGPKPTRVFTESTKLDQLGPLEENGIGTAPSLDAALSPLYRATDPFAGPSVPVPIEKLDSTLDGITLKSTALPPNVVARVMTPPSASPSGGSGCDDADENAQQLSPERKKSLTLKLSDLGPPDINLKRDAGHTPMVILGTDPDMSQSPKEGLEGENSLELTVTTVFQPTERSDSYFPDVKDVTDDPALKGQLSLQNDESKDNGFLAELNQKLLDEARKLLSNGSNFPAEDNTSDEEHDEEELEPELKLKSTTNFGTAFGSSDCGRV